VTSPRPLFRGHLCPWLGGLVRLLAGGCPISLRSLTCDVASLLDVVTSPTGMYGYRQHSTSPALRGAAAVGRGGRLPPRARWQQQHLALAPAPRMADRSSHRRACFLTLDSTRGNPVEYDSFLTAVSGYCFTPDSTYIPTRTGVASYRTSFCHRSRSYRAKAYTVRVHVLIMHVRVLRETACTSTTKEPYY
jgi:hypothetical protein